MRVVLFFISFLCFSQCILAQTSGIIFVGSISVKTDDRQYPYKLLFKDSGGIITGYSVTDIKGPDETKTAIIGTISKSNKEIIFKETHIISTKSAVPRDSFCFLHGKLKVSTMHGTKMLRGHFEGYKDDGTTNCGKGDIMLFSAADVIDKMMGIAAKKDTTKNKVLPTAADVTPEKIVQIAPGTNMVLDCSEGTAIISLWDNAKIDGDIVSVYHNNTLILDHYMLKGDLKELNITLGPTTDTVKLVAISEGAEPPNTARMKIKSGNTVYYLDASSTIEKPTSVILRKKH